MTIPDEQTGYYEAADGTGIFYRRYEAGAERARIIISHGLGEHSGRYLNIVAPLLAEGVSIWAPDHRGHGRSAGKRGHIVHFDQYVEDLRQAVDKAHQDLPAGSCCFLLGHSMGGLIAARYAQQHADDIDALILSSPALGMVVAVPPMKQRLAQLTSALYPGFSMGNELDATKISRDPEVVRSYRDDPLVHDRVSARWFTEFMAAMLKANDEVDAIQVPVLMQVAGDDHLVDPQASKRFFERLPVSDKTYHRYEGAFHEVYNAPVVQREIVLADLVSWISPRTRT